MEIVYWISQQSLWVWVVAAVGSCTAALLWAVVED
jgi:hypothetical protein